MKNLFIFIFIFSIFSCENSTSLEMSEESIMTEKNTSQMGDTNDYDLDSYQYYNFSNEDIEHFINVSSSVVNQIMDNPNFSDNYSAFMSGTDKTVENFKSIFEVDKVLFDELLLLEDIGSRFFMDMSFQQLVLAEYGPKNILTGGSSSRWWDACSGVGHFWGVVSSGAALAIGCATGPGCAIALIYTVNTLNELTNCHT